MYGKIAIIIGIYLLYKYKLSNWSLYSTAMMMFKSYNYVNNKAIKPCKKMLFKDTYIVETYKNSNKITKQLLNDSVSDNSDVVELRWKIHERYYRTIFKGDCINFNVLNSYINNLKSTQLFVLMANLFSYDEINDTFIETDITDILNEYIGFDGDFFKSINGIENKPKYFILENNIFMLSHKNNYIEYMDIFGETHILR